MIQLQRKAYVLVTDVKIWNSFNVYFFTLPRIKTTKKHKRVITIKDRRMDTSGRRKGIEIRMEPRNGASGVNGKVLVT